MARILSKTYQSEDLSNLERHYKGRGVFTFTVDTSIGNNNSDNGTFTIPFESSKVRSYKMCIDWGDSIVTLIDGNDVIDTNLCTHTYEGKGVCTIKVFSDKDEMPYISFYDYYNDVDLNSNKLISIDTPLLYMGVESCEKMFYGCNHLESAVEGLLDYNSTVSNVNYMFANCERLTKVNKWFRECNLIKAFEGTLANCTSVQTIPEDLFRDNILCESFKDTFYNCEILNGIEEDLFKYNTEVTTFEKTFYGCKQIKDIPAYLFKYNTKVKSFKETFSKTGITLIPSSLFYTTTLVEDISYCFAFCKELDLNSSNNSLLSYLTLLNTVEGLFTGCYNIQVIPTNIFQNNTKIKSFRKTFAGCGSITGIPSILFQKNTEAETFEECFCNCIGLTTLSGSEGCFSYCTKATVFKRLFQGCRGLKSLTNLELPESAEDLISLMDGCLNLESFSVADYLPNAKYYRRALADCRMLQTITDKFTNNEKAISFDSIFEGDLLLKTIPTGIFKDCKNATGFNRAFYNCICAEYNANIFCNEATEKEERFKDMTVDFRECFYRQFAYPENLGTVPALWEYTGCNAVNYNCFGGANSLLSVSNYDDIPESWGKSEFIQGEFVFSIQVSANGTFRVPFEVNQIMNTNMTIDWGDGEYSVVEVGETLVENDIKHTYTTAGVYEVAIITDNLKMPLFSFSNVPASASMIITVDSPFLNMGNKVLDGLFTGCSNLISVCDSLFINNFMVTSVKNLFKNCTSMKSIPDKLFDCCYYLEYFDSTFENSGINKIPDALFKVTKAKSFKSTFKGCLNINKVPVSLFAGLDKATNYSETFYGCNNLTLNASIFGNKTDLLSQNTVDFTNFYHIDTAGDYLSVGYAPPLWTFTFQSVTKTGCFSGTAVADAIVNYDEIPSAWK